MSDMTDYSDDSDANYGDETAGLDLPDNTDPGSAIAMAGPGGWVDQWGNVYDSSGTMVSTGPEQAGSGSVDNANTPSASMPNARTASAGSGGTTGGTAPKPSNPGVPTNYGNARPTTSGTVPLNTYQFPIGPGQQLPTTNDMVGQPMYRMVTRGYPQGVVVATSPGVGGAPNAATVAGAMSSSSPILMLAAAVILILVLRK